MAGNGKHRKKPQPAHVIMFIQTHKFEAEAIAVRTGVPAEVILAQSALESDWGRAVHNNAYFGVKGKSPTGNSTAFTTHEYTAQGKVKTQATFRAYTGFSESAEDYASLIRRRYARALAHKEDPVKFAQVIAEQGYATDPAYGKKLASIIHGHVVPVIGKRP